MLSGRKDEVVPAKLMDRLWDVASKRGEDHDDDVIGLGCWPRQQRRRRQVITVKGSGGTADVEVGKTEMNDEKNLPKNHDVFERFEKGTHCKPFSISSPSKP